jgi:hypothetical protein
VAKLLRLGWILAFACAALIYPLYGLLSLMAKEVVFVTPFEDRQVKINRGMFKLDPPEKTSPDWRKKVMGIYGLPNEQPDVVVFVPAGKITNPPEDPSISFMLVDKDKGENPWQLKTFLFVAKWASLGAGLSGVLLLLGWLALRKKAAPPALPASPSSPA